MLLGESLTLLQWALLAAAFSCALILLRHSARRRPLPIDDAPGQESGRATPPPAQMSLP